MGMGPWGGQLSYHAHVVYHNTRVNKNELILLGLDSTCRLFVKCVIYLKCALVTEIAQDFSHDHASLI